LTKAREQTNNHVYPDTPATNPKDRPCGTILPRSEKPCLPSQVPTKSQWIVVAERDLQEIRTGRLGRIQLLSEEEALYWLQQRREGAKPKGRDSRRKLAIGKNRNEVRE